VRTEEPNSVCYLAKKRLGKRFQKIRVEGQRKNGHAGKTPSHHKLPDDDKEGWLSKSVVDRYSGVPEEIRKGEGLEKKEGIVIGRGPTKPPKGKGRPRMGEGAGHAMGAAHAWGHEKRGTSGGKKGEGRGDVRIATHSLKKGFAEKEMGSQKEEK